MQAFVDGLRGVHRFEAPAGRGTSGDYDEAVGNRLMISEQPLVRVHPETGDWVLYVSPDFLKSVVGLTTAESRHLLEMLWEHAVQPRFTVRFPVGARLGRLLGQSLDRALGARRHLLYGLRPPVLPRHPHGRCAGRSRRLALHHRGR